jgi:hypothetical protein
VKSLREAEFDVLDRKVLAVQSGGGVLEPTNDLASEIARRIEENSTFYTVSFNPSPADHPNDYHDLNVRVGTSGMTARTVTGYYDQPYYQDQPIVVAKRVTVEQFEQVLKAARGKSDREAVQRLSTLELTEQLSSAKLSSWSADLRGPKAREALVALADASAFLAPPASEIPEDAAPDASAQGSMISLADEYLNETISKLPNFFATRTTVRFEETPAAPDGGQGSSISPCIWWRVPRQRCFTAAATRK